MWQKLSWILLPGHLSCGVYTCLSGPTSHNFPSASWYSWLQSMDCFLPLAFSEERCWQEVGWREQKEVRAVLQGCRCWTTAGRRWGPSAEAMAPSGSPFLQLQFWLASRIGFFPLSPQAQGLLLLFVPLGFPISCCISSTLLPFPLLTGYLLYYFSYPSWICHMFNLDWYTDLKLKNPLMIKVYIPQEIH